MTAMTTFTATFENGKTWTRNTKRVFTHAVLMTDKKWGNLDTVNWASSFELARKKGMSETGDERAFQTFEIAIAEEATK